MQLTGLPVSPVASAIGLLGGMSAADRDRVFATFARDGNSPSPASTLFEIDHPPAGWRSIKGVPPIGALASIFTSSSWLSRYKRGTDIQAYSATCPALKQLAIDLDRQVAKIGTCEVGRLEDRLRGLGRQRYGGVRRDGHAHVNETGFSSYEHMDRLKIAAQPPGCPVRNSGYGLIVTSHRGFRQNQFDLRFNLALRPFRLTTFADSDEGRRTCAIQGVSVDRLVRYYGCGRDALQGAEEFLVVDPFKDGSRLATVLALVVVQEVAPDLVPENLRKLVPRVGAAANDPALA